MQVHGPTHSRTEELYRLIEGIEIAMFTTRRADGHLVSRPMATQARSSGADLWFVTDNSTDKLAELNADEHVNIAYYNMKSREYVSVSGTARVVDDRSKIRESYRPDWKAWFSSDDQRSGTPDDPRITLNRGRGDHGGISENRQTQTRRFIRSCESRAQCDLSRGRVQHVPARACARYSRLSIRSRLRWR